jgi:hypothetical protein
MDAFFSKAIDLLLSQGPVCVVLCIAAWWLARRDERKEASSTESTSQLLKALSAERAELLDTLNTERTDRIQILESHVVECNSRHDTLQKEMRDLLVRMVHEPRKEHPPQQRSS